MRHYKSLYNHMQKYYNRAAAEAKRATTRLNARGLLVAMTPAGLRAELRSIGRRLALDTERLRLAVEAPEVARCVIYITWRRNATWGWCPRAEAVLIDDRGATIARRESRTVTGCGYDKESTAVAEALAGIPAYNKLIWSNWGRCSDGDHPCYYSDRDPLPHLSFGGAGMGALRRYVEKAGYEWQESHSRVCDIYTFNLK